MLIDWFTTAAQAVNFLILVYLLKRFLYGPIIRTMNAREEKIASRLEEAERNKDEAEEEAETFRLKNRDLDERRERLVEEAREEAEANKRELTEKARQEVEELRTQWLRGLDQGKKTFITELRKRAIEQVYETVRKAFSDLATVDLEEHMTDVFAERLKSLDKGSLGEIRRSLKKAGGGVAVASAFEMPPGKRHHVTRVIHETIEDGIEVDYQTEPELISGIELKAPGNVLGWNLREYMESLEREVSQAISEETEEGET